MLSVDVWLIGALNAISLPIERPSDLKIGALLKASSIPADFLQKARGYSRISDEAPAISMSPWKTWRVTFSGSQELS